MWIGSEISFISKIVSSPGKEGVGKITYFSHRLLLILVISMRRFPLVKPNLLLLLNFINALELLTKNEKEGRNIAIWKKLKNKKYRIIQTTRENYDLYRPLREVSHFNKLEFEI